MGQKFGRSMTQICTFILPLLVQVYFTDARYNGSIFCFNQSTKECMETEATYGKLCFIDILQCQKFTNQMKDYFVYYRPLQECTYRLSAWVNVTSFETKAACNKYYKSYMVKDKERGCTIYNQICPKFVPNVQFRYSKKRKMCIVKTLPNKYANRFQYGTYRACMMAHMDRHCFDSKTKSCSVYSKPSSRDKKLCFAHSSGCEIYKEWSSTIWYFNDRLQQCTSTRPNLKKIGQTYYTSKAACNRPCYKMVGNRCVKALEYNSICDPMNKVFYTEADCMECLSAQSFYRIDVVCKKTNLLHDYTPIYCSLGQCKHRLKIKDIFFEPSKLGKYYHIRKGCIWRNASVYDPYRSFSTQEECLNMRKKGEQLRYELVWYTPIRGRCYRTMNLSIIDLYKTKEECEKSIMDKEPSSYFVLYELSTCKEIYTAKRPFQRRNYIEDYRFKSREECLRYRNEVDGDPLWPLKRRMFEHYTYSFIPASEIVDSLGLAWWLSSEPHNT